METNILNSTYTAYMLCFYVFLFISIAAIAKETELPKIMRTAYSNIMLVPIFLVAAQTIMVYITINAQTLGDFSARLYGTGLLLSLLVTILTAILLFKCYARICLEGDEEMEKRAYDLKSPLDYYEKNKKSNSSSVNNKNKNKK
jgi:glucan phosphoethanolaminetransferase (alkaline phosphatase superfamily)